MTVPTINDAHDHDLSIDPQQSPIKTFNRFLITRKKSLSLIESLLQKPGFEKVRRAEHSKMSHCIGIGAQHDRHHLNHVANLLKICKIN